MEDYKSQFVEIHNKLDKIFELLPNWLSSKGIEHTDPIVFPSAQVTSNLGDDLLESSKALDSYGSDEKVTAIKQSWIGSEGHWVYNRYSVEEESIEDTAESYAHKLFDEMTESIQEALLVEQLHTKMARMHTELNLHLFSSFGNEQTIEERHVEENVCSVFGEMFVHNRACNMFDEMSNPESMHCDELQEAEDVGNENSDEIMLQIEEDSGKEVTLTTYIKVLDKLPKPSLTEIAAYMSIDELDAHCVLNSQTGEKFDQVIGNSEVEAFKVINKSTEPNFAGYTFLHSFTQIPLFRNEEENDVSFINVDNWSVNYKLDNKWLNVILMLIFDPGGCSRLNMGCGSFKCCKEQGDYRWAVNVAKPLIISDPLITCQEACNEWSDPNVREVKTFILAAPMTGSVNGSTMAWFEKVTSILKVALGKNVLKDNAHEVFDKSSKIRTHVDGILMFVYDPGGSFPLQMDCESLKFDIRFQHTVTLHYAVGVLADVSNFSIDWDYTLNMIGIISKVIEMCLVQVVPKIVVDCPYKHLSMLIIVIILNAVPKATVSSMFFPQYLICICLVEPKKELYANKYDRVLLSLDSVNGLRYVERRCWFTLLSMNNLVHPSPNSVTFVCYGSIVTVTCLLFDPGGGYLLLTASRDTLCGKYTRNAESSVPKDMCVGTLELGSNKACKPQLLLDYLFLTQEALDLDDVELGHMTFSIVPTLLLPGVVPKIVVVSSDFVIEADVISISVRKDVRTIRHFYVVADKIKLLYGGELATKMFMFNDVEWNLQTEHDWSVWPEAISLDITIIHCLAELFCQLLVL